MGEEPQTASGKRLLLAYAGSSAELVKPLHRAFEAAGFEVEAAPDDKPLHDHPVDKVRAVVVCWTPAAVASDGVNLQAARAQKARKLVPILLAPCSPPGNLGGLLRPTDLSGWRGDPADREFRELVQSLHGRLSGGALGSLLGANIFRSRYFTWGSAGAAALGAVAIIANFSDLRQTIDGFTNPGASERSLSATNAKVEEVLTLLKQRSPQPLSADAEAALRESIEGLLSAQSGARGAAAEKLAAGDFEGALAELQAAADEGEKAAQALAETWKEIGALSFATDKQTAIGAYTRATELSPNDSDARNLLGSLHLRTGNYEEALRAMEQVSWFEEDEAKRAVALGNLGVVALNQDDPDEAERLFRESLAINEKLGDKDGQAADLADLSDVTMRRGNAARATEMLRRALTFYTETDNLVGQSNVHGRLGSVAFERGRLTEALTAYSTASELADASGETEAIAAAQLNLADAADATGKLDDAVEHYEAALMMAQVIGARMQEAQALSGLGDVAFKRKDKTAAIEHYRNSMRIYMSAGMDRPAAQLRALLEELGAKPSPEGPEN
ncbi:MAG: toll/interleukin-1 receptor domain-containing protein [Alphaproteobacteria bacterium]|nr:MAG: toll/interleukin-1 receptor domain-containing protein [Alphaproteobacteria bacterium]